MISHVRDIKNSIEASIQTTLGVTYKKLAYVEDVEKNSFRTNNERFGVRALFSGEVESVTKNPTFLHSFEIVISKAYLESNLDDEEQVEKALDNFENMLCIYKELVNSRAGVPSIVLNVTNLQMAEPEYLVDSKVAVQRATIDITYRFSLI